MTRLWYTVTSSVPPILSEEGWFALTLQEKGQTQGSVPSRATPAVRHTARLDQVSWTMLRALFWHPICPHSHKPVPTWPSRKRTFEGPRLKSSLQFNKCTGTFSSHIYSADRKDSERTKAREIGDQSVPSLTSAFQEYEYPCSHPSNNALVPEPLTTSGLIPKVYCGTSHLPKTSLDLFYKLRYSNSKSFLSKFWGDKKHECLLHSMFGKPYT